MDIEKYISSGLLELYIAGILSEKENLEISKNAEKHTAIKQEIEAIEAAILALSKAASPGFSLKNGFNEISKRIHIEDTKVVALPKRKTNWAAYAGWAASVLLALGLFWMVTKNNELKTQITVADQEKIDMESQIEDANSSLEKSKELLSTLRDKNIQVVALGGQKVSPTSYAKAYWNKEEKKVFIDAQGLPEPPDGMVYQVWSLKLSPLTPTSVGLLSDFASDDNKIFALDNPNDSEAFGITLEPAGGSKSPTMEQLYALGVAAASS